MQVRSQINVAPLIDVVVILLAIYAAVWPVVVRMETLEAPRWIGACECAPDTRDVLILRVNDDLSMTLFHTGRQGIVAVAELAGRLQPEVDREHEQKVVYVDFAPHVLWSDVVATMDTIRSLASDADHDEIRVALATSSGSFERADE
jgi:biopolymer transport protein ExbD